MLVRIRVEKRNDSHREMYKYYDREIWNLMDVDEGFNKKEIKAI